MMKIYISHDRSSDFTNELYIPLREAKLQVEFIFPHEESDPYNSKELFRSRGCDFVLAETSIPSTGQGIELGWADVFGIPIICFYKNGTKPSRSLQVISKKIIEYHDSSDLVNKLTVELGLNLA